MSRPLSDSVRAIKARYAYELRVMLGCCVRCDAPAAPDSVRCERHRAMAAEASRRLHARRVEVGTCRHCTAPSEEGITLCQAHRETQNEATRLHRQLQRHGLAGGRGGYRCTLCHESGHNRRTCQQRTP